MNQLIFLKKKFRAGNERGAILIVGLLVILALTVFAAGHAPMGGAVWLG
jgi:Tfp pilus assembly protein PilX